MSDGFELIDLRHPRKHDVVNDPLQVSGVGVSPHALFGARVRDANGKELQRINFPGAGAGVWTNFHFTIDLPQGTGGPHGTLEVFGEGTQEEEPEVGTVTVPITFGNALIPRFIGVRIHEVLEGETLSSIADEHYGAASKFRIIFEANRDQIEDPKVIPTGWLLRIPVGE